MIDDWKLLWRVNLVEVWKTPTRYLTCCKYMGQFKFFDNEQAAYNAIQELSSL